MEDGQFCNKLSNYMKIGAIIQARTGSKRLPNKIKLNLPYNSNILRQDKEICLDKFQPSIDDVKERIKRTGRWGRILKNCIDFTYR